MLSNKRADNQAYKAAYWFLEEIWQTNKDIYTYDLVLLVGHMVLVSDGKPWDSSYEYDWADASEKKPQLISEETYAAMVRLLEYYRSLGEGESKDITSLLNELALFPEKYQRAWEGAVRDALTSVSANDAGNVRA